MTEEDSHCRRVVRDVVVDALVAQFGYPRDALEISDDRVDMSTLGGATYRVTIEVMRE